MQLEDYFEFEAPDRIRVKGSRLLIDFIIEDYLKGLLPEQIVSNYRRSVTLEQVFATLTYYLHNKAGIDALLERNRAAADARYEEYLKQEPSEVIKRLRAMQTQSSTPASA